MLKRLTLTATLEFIDDAGKTQWKTGYPISVACARVGDVIASAGNNSGGPLGSFLGIVQRTLDEGTIHEAEMIAKEATNENSADEAKPKPRRAKPQKEADKAAEVEPAAAVDGAPPARPAAAQHS